ncbi:HvfC/BufC family peptide modification chaperone [Planktotalea sp.]|uniref:HvfC/BufC family peptide modification chaperone n=1 Tax=Planktotalea sp. TaxID=2029877 RepID=UPI003D6BEAD0
MMTSQSDFRAALFDPQIVVPISLTDGQSQPAGKRFDVYRNNVIMSLKEAMSESFPVIEKLIGTQNFASLAGLFVRKHPPKDPRMMLYGIEFPSFLETFEPLSHLGYLPDVARLELARRHSYHAADARPIDPSVFGTLPPEVLASATLSFAPALRVVRSDWPILDIWHFNMTDGAAKPTAGAQDVLLTRAEFDPEMHLLPAGSADLIEALAKETKLGDALDTLENTHPGFDFSALLGLLIQTNALTALSATP